MKEFRDKSECICGRVTHLQYDDRIFQIKERAITVKNTPHFYCSYCDKASYDSLLNVDDFLIYAYKNNLDVIEWEAAPDEA